MVNLNRARQSETVTKEELLAAIEPIRDFLDKKTKFLTYNSVDACLLCVEVLSQYMILKEKHERGLNE